MNEKDVQVDQAGQTRRGLPMQTKSRLKIIVTVVGLSLLLTSCARTSNGADGPRGPIGSPGPSGSAGPQGDPGLDGLGG